MTWIKLDDNAVDHPKVANLSDRAFRWWVKGLSYASRFLTDGVLSPVFWKPIPKSSRGELTRSGLWQWEDPNFLIHDYLHHQSSKESVTQKKADTAERVARYRERKRNAVTDQESSPDGNALVTRPEIRDQIQRSEIREQRQQENAPPRLGMSLAYIDKRLQQCAFVGVRLEVPLGLHADLQKLLGGANADAELRSWYVVVDADIAASGEAIAPDVFRWLKSRYAKWKPSATNGASVNDQIDGWVNS